MSKTLDTATSKELEEALLTARWNESAQRLRELKEWRTRLSNIYRMEAEARDAIKQLRFSIEECPDRSRHSKRDRCQYCTWYGE